MSSSIGRDAGGATDALFLGGLAWLACGSNPPSGALRRCGGCERGGDIFFCGGGGCRSAPSEDAAGASADNPLEGELWRPPPPLHRARPRSLLREPQAPRSMRRLRDWWSPGATFKPAKDDVAAGGATLRAQRSNRTLRTTRSSEGSFTGDGSDYSIIKVNRPAMVVVMKPRAEARHGPVSAWAAHLQVFVVLPLSFSN